MPMVNVRRDVVAFLMALAAEYRNPEGDRPSSLYDLDPEDARKVMREASNPESFLQDIGLQIPAEEFPWSPDGNGKGVVTGVRSSKRR